MSKDINTNFKDFTSGYSIEVIPRSAAKIESFSDLLPKNTRVYLAHLETEDISAMIATAKRLNREGFTVMPHIPARLIQNQAMLNDWISMYQNEAGVDEALLLAGGSKKPVGDFDSSIN
jgi:methylenetetrahydrofolate reductase (NADPH)